MQTNVGGFDRSARLAAGTALLAGALFAPLEARWRALMGLGAAVSLGTALSGYCPANAALGIDTAGDDDEREFWTGADDPLDEVKFQQLKQVETGASGAGVVAA